MIEQSCVLRKVGKNEDGGGVSQKVAFSTDEIRGRSLRMRQDRMFSIP